jgi:hypothetical protein
MPISTWLMKSMNDNIGIPCGHFVKIILTPENGYTYMKKLYTY